MTDPTGRTPEQKTADDNLTEAVNQVADAYGYTQPGFINNEYLVVLHQRGWGNNVDDTYSGVVLLYRDGSLPWMAIHGLMEMARRRLGRDYDNAIVEDSDES
jgi:hypothetical protein